MVDDPVPSIPDTAPLHSPRFVTAVEHIRRMRGGSQAHLMRCSDGHFYVVKFRNNPQSPRVLTNEYIAGRLAKLLHLPCRDFCFVDVREDLVRLTPDLSIQWHRGDYPVTTGLAFGSQFPSWLNSKKRILFPVLELRSALGLGRVANLYDLVGMLVFDKWTCNTDNRQIGCLEEPLTLSRTFQMFMMDNGFCFGAHDWSFTDLPRYGLYFDKSIYSRTQDSRSLHPWLERLETNVTSIELHKIADELPESWVKDDREDLLKMLTRLYERKKTVASLVHLAMNWLKSLGYEGFGRGAAAD
jgi:hypothetical protein